MKIFLKSSAGSVEDDNYYGRGNTSAVTYYSGKINNIKDKPQSMQPNIDQTVLAVLQLLGAVSG